MNELDEKIRTQEGARDAPYKAQTVTSERSGTARVDPAGSSVCGVNYEFLAHLLRGSPCVYTPGKVVVVDEYDHSNTCGRASSTMHPKLWILCFADFCRVIVASSNLGAYDNKVNNQYWVHDFPSGRRLEPAARGVLYDSEPRGDAEGADEALAAAVGDAAARRLVAFADGGLMSTARRACQGGAAVHRWCERRGLASASHDDAGEARRILVLTRLATTPAAAAWDEILRSYDLTPPEASTSSAPCRASAGRLRQRSATARSASRFAGGRPSRAEFANSSLGRLDNKVFLRGFATSLFGAGDLDRLKIVWPSQAAACRSSRKLMLRDDRGQGTAQMNGPDDRIWNAAGFPRARFHHYHAPSDRQTLHHTKMLACARRRRRGRRRRRQPQLQRRRLGRRRGQHVRHHVLRGRRARGVRRASARILGARLAVPAPPYDLDGGVEPWSGRASSRSCGPRAPRSTPRRPRRAAADGASAPRRVPRVFRGPFPADTDGGLRAVVVARKIFDFVRFPAIGAVVRGEREALVRVRKRDEKRRDALAPLENAKAAAAWVRRNYDVVVIEPGRAEAAERAIRPEPLSASELSRDKADHFKDEAVPLLRELVAEPRVAVALATVWGQSVADPSRALVVGAEHDTAATARAAKLDYIGVKLCSGTGLDWKKVRWDSDAAGDDAIINFPNG
ncbi:tyrosyl-DNA phosphodiesterase [Aureococcus anophagefferens]|nr:tyrosyl-DNA phosphodiesterase [Aureococcus anophagefferens]